MSLISKAFHLHTFNQGSCHIQVVFCNPLPLTRALDDDSPRETSVRKVPPTVICPFRWIPNRPSISHFVDPAEHYPNFFTLPILLLYHRPFCEAIIPRKMLEAMHPDDVRSHCRTACMN
jgi:hypothetical protein